VKVATVAGPRFVQRLSSASGPQSLGWLIVVGFLVHLALRLALGVGRDGPVIFADETGYLANARVMSDGVVGQLSLASFYRGGYSLLLLPAYWLGDGPHSRYDLVLATNALLSSLVFPLLYLLLRRVFAVPVRIAYLAGFLAALYPPLLATTQFAWAESLLPVLVLLAAITLGGVVSASRPLAAGGWAIGCGVCAGALYTTHGRTAPLVLMLVGLLLVLALVRHELAAGSTAGVVAAMLVMTAGQGLNAWLSTRSWGTTPNGDLDRVWNGARDLGVLKTVAALEIGQYWYLFVVTFGLAILGLGRAGAYLVPSGRSGRQVVSSAVAPETGGATVIGAFLVGSTIGLTLLVGLFFSPPVRAEQVVHGRYVEILVPPLLALGLVRLWTAQTRRLLFELAVGAIAAAVASVIIIKLFAGNFVIRGRVNWTTVLGLAPLGQTPERIRPVTALLVALAGAGVLLAVTRRSRAWAAIGLAAVLVVMSLSLRVVLIEARDRATYDNQPVALSTVPGLNGAYEVSYDMAAYTPIGLFGYQWELDHARFVLFDSRRDRPPRTEWVIAGLDWPQARKVGAHRVWVHPAYQQAVWHVAAGGRLPTSWARPRSRRPTAERVPDG
jgi:hypothetical protein